MAEQVFVNQRAVLARMTRELGMICPSLRCEDDGHAFVLHIAREAPERQEAHLRATAAIRFDDGRVPFRIVRDL